MAKSKSEKCIELLVTSAAEVTDEQLAQASGMTLKTVRRLRQDEEFIGRTLRRAKQRFLARMPQVLQALIGAAADGKNASAMKLFLDTCRDFESEGATGEPGDATSLEEYLERVNTLLEKQEG